MKYANLHLHSVYSDGVLTPLELCQKAKEMGYGAIALTDHDTVSGVEDLKKACAETGMDYIQGMEAAVGARELGCSFHIVAYDFDPTAPEIAEYIRQKNEYTYAKTKAKFDAGIELGVYHGFTWQDVLDLAPKGAWINNEHLFLALIKYMGYTQADYWNYSKAFADHKIEIKAPRCNFTYPRLIKAIRDAGGVASLAHPRKTTQHLPLLVDLGLNCVEYDHPVMDSYDGTEAYRFAVEHNLYLAGGTDHTGQLANHAVERGISPNFDPVVAVCPTVRDVYNGSTKEEFEALKNRIYG